MANFAEMKGEFWRARFSRARAVARIILMFNCLNRAAASKFQRAKLWYLKIMATKLNHTTALNVVYNVLTSKEINSLKQPEPSEKTKELAKQLKQSQIDDYNAARGESLGTTFRKIAHVVAISKKLDEQLLVEEFLPNGKVTALTDTLDRIGTYLMNCVNARIDAQLPTKETRINVNVAQLKKMYRITESAAQCAEFFGITEEQVNTLLNK